MPVRIQRTQYAQDADRLASHRRRLLRLEDLDQRSQQPRVLQVRIGYVARVRRQTTQRLERCIPLRDRRMHGATRQLRHHQRDQLIDEWRQLFASHSGQLAQALCHAGCNTRMCIVRLWEQHLQDR